MWGEGGGSLNGRANRGKGVARVDSHSLAHYAPTYSFSFTVMSCSYKTQNVSWEQIVTRQLISFLLMCGK